MRRRHGLRASAAVVALLMAVPALASACGSSGSVADQGAGAGSAVSESPAANTSALASLIEAENAAVYAYGVIGAHLGGGDRSRALGALKDHRRLRDAWIVAASAAGVAIPPAALAYDLPFRVRDRATALALSKDIETRLIATYEAAGTIATQAREQSRSRLADLPASG